MRECSLDRPVWSWRWIGLAAVGCLLSPGRAVAQPAASGRLSLNDAGLPQSFNRRNPARELIT